MVKKSIADKLKQTTSEQQQENKDRFSKADSVLLRKASGETEPLKKGGQALNKNSYGTVS